MTDETVRPVTTLSATVMSHPTRSDALLRLVNRLDTERVFPGVVVDHGRQGVWPTARRAWQERPAHATHHLVIQDDALPVDGFAEYLTAALAVVPDEVVSLFCLGLDPVRAQAAGSHWFTRPTISSAVAVVMPVDMIDEWLDWDAGHVRPEYRHDDARIALWALHTARDIYYTAPCLVDHDETLPSIAGNRPPIPRRAAVLAVGRIDWSRGADSPVRRPGHRLAAYRQWRIE